MSRFEGVFLGSIATKTNTISLLGTELRDFKDSFYAPSGEHRETPTLFRGPCHINPSASQLDQRGSKFMLPCPRFARRRMMRFEAACNWIV